MHYIDAHVHVWTPDTDHYPLAVGFTKEDMKPPSFTPEQLFAHCRPSGVERMVLIQMSFYRFDNSYMLDMMKLHSVHSGGKTLPAFAGVAVIDPHADRPDDELRRLLKLAVRGFRIYGGAWKSGKQTDKPDFAHWLDAPGYARMFATAAETGQAICGLINPQDLPALDTMCRRFPDSPVVIDHMCRIGADGQIRDADVKALCDMAKHKHVRVKLSAFYAFGKKKPPHDDLIPMIRRLFDAYGPERLMWASDCPFQVDNETYADSISLVHDRLDFLAAGDREWVLRKTAERTFF
ncbi:MAG: amidohydrolase family protein [Planctomycetes bacterium]|nr:amidohydrolase family protein [Planctomycetota bacterium]